MATNSGTAPDEKPVVVERPQQPRNSGLSTALSGLNLLGTLGMLAVLVMSFVRDKQRTSVEDISRGLASEAEGEKKGKESEGGSSEKGGDKKKAEYGRMINLDQFTVNLSTPGSTNAKYVRVNISLEVPTEDIEAEIAAKSPQVRNTIIDLFNSKRPADLASSEGRDFIKEEIKNAINGFLISGKVKGVYFTSFALST